MTNSNAVNQHSRDNGAKYNVKHGAFRYPDNVISVEHDIFKRGENIPRNEHIFCAYCGREITMFHVERCRVVCIDRHIRVITSDDEIMYYCLPYERCMEDRKKGVISQGIKTNLKQYVGVTEYGLQDLWS